MGRKRITSASDAGKLDESKYLSSGCTVLNLRLTGHPDCAWKRGAIHNIIGDSFAGKTIMLWTAFAEACSNPVFDPYSIYYDEPEESFEIDIKKHFGREAYKRVIREDNAKFKNSASIEKFGARLPKLVAEPVIIGLDSYDALDCEDDNKQEVGKRAYPSKPRILTDILRRNVDKIEASGSILFIISQQRDKLDAVMFGSKKRRAGGQALKFYSTTELWLAVYKPITRTFRGVKEEVGNVVTAKVTKNKANGKVGRSNFPLIRGYGIDDVISQIDFHLQYKQWKKSNGVIASPWGKLTTNDLITHIEENKLQKELKRETTSLWNKIEDAIKQDRVKRYK